MLSKVEYALSFGELGTAINTIPYEYNAGQSPDAVTKYGNETVHYDTYGNAVSYRGYTFTWAKARQLATASISELTMSFKYDFNGIRTKKTVNGVDTEYFYVGDTLVSQKTGNEVINFAYTAGGTPYGFTHNGISYFYLLNIQGDIIGIYDSNGNVVVEYTYDSWGKLISITGSLADTIGIKNPLRYRGYYYDTEISLYYLQSRYYDPEIGRFINMDTYFIAGNDYIQGTNMYAYCYNNPVMYSDLTGYGPEDALILFFGALSFVAILAEAVPFEQAKNIITFIGSLNLSVNGLLDMFDLVLSAIADDELIYLMSGAGSAPPDHPDFTPPKKGNRKVKTSNGYGWEAKDGGVWVWTPGMHGGDGWTVQYPNGDHKHAYPGGGTRNHISLDGPLDSGVLIGIGALATVVLLADNITVVGTLDDTLIPVIWSAVLA